MTRFRLTCPVCCGGVITPWGRTNEGNHRGYCAHCYHRVTITVHADDVPVGIIDRDAPFYPLVELVDKAGKRA